jgi:hypothetical protein
MLAMYERIILKKKVKNPTYIPCHFKGTHQKFTKFTGNHTTQSIKRVRINFYFTYDL